MSDLIEQFVKEKRICHVNEHNRYARLHPGARCACANVILVDDLRELVNGKVLVPWLALRIAVDCFEDFKNDYAKTPTDDPATREKLMWSYNEALRELREALSTTGAKQ